MSRSGGNGKKLPGRPVSPGRLLVEQGKAAFLGNCSWAGPSSYTRGYLPCHIPAPNESKVTQRRVSMRKLAKHIEPGKRFGGVAVLEGPKTRLAYLNTGSELAAIWQNGKRVYKDEGWTDWHATKRRQQTSEGSSYYVPI
jgi:hypothetical protein